MTQDDGDFQEELGFRWRWDETVAGTGVDPQYSPEFLRYAAFKAARRLRAAIRSRDVICDFCSGSGVRDETVIVPRREITASYGEGETAHDMMGPPKLSKWDIKEMTRKRLEAMQTVLWVIPEHKVFIRTTCAACFGLGGGPQLAEIQHDVFEAEFLFSSPLLPFRLYWCERCQTSHPQSELVDPYLRKPDEHHSYFVCGDPNCGAVFSEFPTFGGGKDPSSLLSVLRFGGDDGGLNIGRLCKKCARAEVTVVHEKGPRDPFGKVIKRPVPACPTCGEGLIEKNDWLECFDPHIPGWWNSVGRIAEADFGKYVVTKSKFSQTPLATLLGATRLVFDENGLHVLGTKHEEGPGSRLYRLKSLENVPQQFKTEELVEYYDKQIKARCHITIPLGLGYGHLEPLEVAKQNILSATLRYLRHLSTASSDELEMARNHEQQFKEWMLGLKVDFSSVLYIKPTPRS